MPGGAVDQPDREDTILCATRSKLERRDIDGSRSRDQMTDYYPLIGKAVAGLEKNTGEARRVLYERARTALVGQLRNMNPPLSESEITRERLALEEAIRKVEAEAARRLRMEPPRPDTLSGVRPGAPSNAPTPSAPPSPPAPSARRRTPKSGAVRPLLRLRPCRRPRCRAARPRRRGGASPPPRREAAALRHLRRHLLRRARPMKARLPRPPRSRGRRSRSPRAVATACSASAPR